MQQVLALGASAWAPLGPTITASGCESDWAVQGPAPARRARSSSFSRLFRRFAEVELTSVLPGALAMLLLRFQEQASLVVATNEEMPQAHSLL